MNKLITTNNGGFPIVLDDFRWLLGQATSGNAGIYQLLIDMLLPYGTDFKIQGCAATGSPYPTALSEGWIMLNSEILKVDAQAISYGNYYFVKVTTYEAAGNKTFESGTSVDTYQKNRGVANAASGTLQCTEDSPLGFIRATNAEAIAMTLTTKGITPANMAYLKASTAEAQALSINTKYITPSRLGDVTGGLVTKVLNIGDWNMDSTSYVNVAHGLADWTKIRTINVLIRDDADTVLTNLNGADDTGVLFGIATATSTNIVLWRTTGGGFDSTLFNATSYNRGYITIQYAI